MAISARMMTAMLTSASLSSLIWGLALRRSVQNAFDLRLGTVAPTRQDAPAGIGKSARLSRTAGGV